jgi:hypothetical protein
LTTPRTASTGSGTRASTSASYPATSTAAGVPATTPAIVERDVLPVVCSAAVAAPDGSGRLAALTANVAPVCCWTGRPWVASTTVSVRDVEP